jgi:hypothetical protein
MDEAKLEQLLKKPVWTRADVLEVAEAARGEGGYPEQWAISSPELTRKLCELLLALTPSVGGCLVRGHSEDCDCGGAGGDR